MIHTIAVLAGDDDFAHAAQQHALRMAQWFRARLRVVMAREPGCATGDMAETQPMDGFGARAVERLTRDAGGTHVSVEPSIRGEGVLDGMLAEAQESDLLVVGLSPDPAAGTDPVVAAVRHAEQPLLHRAECLVLVVCQAPRQIKNVLVDYKGGTVGKAALRAAGEVALRASAGVTVLCVDGDIGRAVLLSGIAESYLAGYGLPTVVSVTRVGQSGSATEVAKAARSTAADLVVIGGAGHGLLDWLRDRTGPDPEDVAVLTQIPVLVAR